MKNGVCVGGINENTYELVRLHNERGGNLGIDAPYQVGDRWMVDMETAWNVRPCPHVEDKQTSPIEKIENVGARGVARFVREHEYKLGKRLTRGVLSRAFEGCLHFDGNKKYIGEDMVPGFSTQFWIADKDLVHEFSFNKDYYRYGPERLTYVGCQDCVGRIPAGTIIRLSLANWWDGDGSGEPRCYLQLSGWYL